MKQRWKVRKSNNLYQWNSNIRMNEQHRKLIPFEKISGVREPGNIKSHQVVFSDSSQIPLNSRMISENDRIFQIT